MFGFYMYQLFFDHEKLFMPECLQSMHRNADTGGIQGPNMD
jgi:hypothetical protein